MRSLFLFVTLALAALFFGGCTQVPANNAGIPFWIDGTMGENPVSEGLHMSILTSYELVPLTGQTYTVEVPYGSGTTAVSSDRQSLGFSANLSWKVATAQGARDLMYHMRDPAAWQAQIIAPVVDQAIKSVVVRYTLEEVTAERDRVTTEIAAEIDRLVEVRLTEIDESLTGAIDINQFLLTNLDYDPGLKDSIEQTQIVAQERVRAQANLETQAVNFQLRVAEAEADRQAAVERATGEAEAMQIRTQALQNQFRSIAAAGVEPNLYVAASRWNGQLPSMISGDGGGDFASLLVSIPASGPVQAPVAPTPIVSPAAPAEGSAGPAATPVPELPIPRLF